MSESPNCRTALIGPDGELLSVCVDVEPRRLEAVLEALASLSFPVNPEIIHRRPGNSVTVEFPAYEVRLADVRDILAPVGIGASSIETRSALASE
jgi:hypothetical protein